MKSNQDSLKTQPLDSIQIALLSLIRSEAEDLVEREGKRPELKRIIEASQKMFNGASAQMMSLLPATRQALADLDPSAIADLLNRFLAENPANISSETVE
jgi:flagellar motility protein MotE (MotC chaperone)